jgi:ketosteroid isomerase-like protein
VIIEPEKFLESGDQIVVFLLARLRPQGSNSFVESRVSAIWTMRDGKAISCEMYPEREKALEAAGLAGEGR